MVRNASITEVRKKVTKLYELISTSYHESGHTVYALLCGMKVNSVCIFEHKVFKRIHGSTDYEYQELGKENPNFIPMLEQEVGMNYAGLLAERYHFKTISGTEQLPMFIKEGSWSDLRVVQKIVADHNLCPAGKKRHAYKKKIAKKTKDILLQYWDAIELVAHALFKRKRLSYDDLKRLLTTQANDNKFWREKFRIIDGLF